MPHASWVAGSVRALALSQRRIGADAARELARQRSLAEALRLLRPSAYGERIAIDASLAEAQHAVGETVLWHLRVLGGWLPPGGASGVETIAGWWELENIRSRLAELAAGRGRTRYELGPLGTLWSLDTVGSTAALRERLRVTPWGDPGSEEPAEMLRYLRLRLAQRVSELGGAAARWASQRAAIWIAEDRFVDRAPSPERVLRRLPRLGSGERRASSLAAYVGRLYADVARPLRGIEEPSDLWKAQVRWWHGVEADAELELTRNRLGPGTWLAAVAVLGVDAWRTKAALALAARGGGSLRRELPDVA